jgi:hypothetical protein
MEILVRTKKVQTTFHYTQDILPVDDCHIITEDGVILYYSSENNFWIFEDDWDNPLPPPKMWAYIPNP